MKLRRQLIIVTVLLVVLLGAVVNRAHVSQPVKKKAVTVNAEKPKELQLDAMILAEQYCSEVGTKFLSWRLKLTYTNVGTRPLLLEKKSTWVYRTLVSRDLKAATARKYLSAPIPAYADLDSFGFRSRPDLDCFVVLKPTESFVAEADSRVSVYDGTRDTEDDLHAGQYILQVRVATLYQYTEPKEYREKWIDRRYLWSDNVTSEPMPFRVEKHPTLWRVRSDDLLPDSPTS